MSDIRRVQMDRADIYVLENDLLVGLSSLEPKVRRNSLYLLPPWRAVAWARIACAMGVLPRAERDGMVREAQYVGGNGKLKPWGDRTDREKERGVRGPGRAPERKPG